MKKQPLISIILSAYNNENYIDAALISVLDQTYSKWEFIIIDDYSTDKTSSILKSYTKQDKRFQYIKNKKNIGQTASLNKGITLAKGKYIARIDSDDIWIDKSKLERQVKFLESHSDYGLIGTLGIAINDKDEEIFKIIYPCEDSQIRKNLLISNTFIHSSVLIRTELIKKVGGYDLKDKVAQDYSMWLKLGTLAKLHNFPEYMTLYRLNSKGISQTKYTLQRQMALKHIKNYRNSYPNYYKAIIVWYIRQLYPRWFRLVISNQMKNLMQNI